MATQNNSSIHHNISGKLNHTTVWSCTTTRRHDTFKLTLVNNKAVNTTDCWLLDKTSFLTLYAHAVQLTDHTVIGLGTTAHKTMQWLCEHLWLIICHVFLQLGKSLGQYYNGRKKAKIALLTSERVTCQVSKPHEQWWICLCMCLYVSAVCMDGVLHATRIRETLSNG